MIQNRRALYIIMIIHIFLILYFGYKYIINEDFNSAFIITLNVIGASTNSIKLSQGAWLYDKNIRDVVVVSLKIKLEKYLIIHMKIVKEL